MTTESLYIHIPFCQHICSYCDFPKVFYNESMADTYLQRLNEELKTIKQPMKTVYIGGGTPGCLSYDQLTQLMRMIRPFISGDTAEVTIEVNPESMTKEKLKLLHDSGVNRLSIGVETFNETLLQRLDRHHTNTQVMQLLDDAAETGFKNISIDMMYGLPGQTINDVREDLQMISHLKVISHVSYYALILEEHTKLYNEHYQLLDEDEDYAISILIDDSLTSYGFHQYEISNYARGDYESLHNKAYWQYDNYYGAGVGATGKIDDELIIHSRSLTRYLKGEPIVTVETQTKEETMFNHVMMSLRLRQGLNLDEFKTRYGVDCLDFYKDAITRHLKQGTLIIDGHYLQTTKESWRLLNTILIDFLKE